MGTLVFLVPQLCGNDENTIEKMYVKTNETMFINIKLHFLAVS